MLPVPNGSGNAFPLHAPSGFSEGPRPPIRQRTLERGREIGEALADPHFELTVEDAAPLFSTFTQLRRAGVEFDPTLTALVAHLERQAFKDDGESDVDHRQPRPARREVAA